MSLSFYPKPGHFLICDFRGYEKPEIVKKRPVIVVSPRLPFRSGIVTVVPVSLTKPIHELGYCVQLSKNYNPKEDDNRTCWAKCDLIANVGLARLDRFRITKTKYIAPTISPEDLRLVRMGVLTGLNFDGLNLMS